jgi:hypothetical protein
MDQFVIVNRYRLSPDTEELVPRAVYGPYASRQDGIDANNEGTFPTPEYNLVVPLYAPTTN